MVKITYAPWQEVVVHEVMELDNKRFFEEIIKQLLAGGGAGMVPSVHWVGGIAFLPVPFPDSEYIDREKEKGNLHFAAVTFTRMEYKPEVSVSVGGNAYSVRLQNSEISPIFSDLAGYLKGLPKTTS